MPWDRPTKLRGGPWAQWAWQALLGMGSHSLCPLALSSLAEMPLAVVVSGLGSYCLSSELRAKMDTWGLT